ncbi:hypothetical protein [Streptomyces sp. DH24]|uniref:hypothetical protein n=1 Tax=Streptomyces sp. DH24 TaxID=3040123 RepID=UPI0024415651|nr:hypothetical protein [Streptomyces sp. DH24]MDG9719790.1 hypothetical protein [Streptomyces sp. DH24]
MQPTQLRPGLLRLERLLLVLRGPLLTAAENLKRLAAFTRAANRRRAIEDGELPAPAADPADPADPAGPVDRRRQEHEQQQHQQPGPGQGQGLQP